MVAIAFAFVWLSAWVSPFEPGRDVEGLTAAASLADTTTIAGQADPSPADPVPTNPVPTSTASTFGPSASEDAVGDSADARSPAVETLSGIAYPTKRQGIVALSAIATAELGSIALRSNINQCRWCDVDSQGRLSLNPLDRWGTGARWTRPDLARTLSWVTLSAAFVVPSFAANHWRVDGDLFRNLTMVGYASVLTYSATTLVKVAAARSRPYTHHDLMVDAQPTADAYQSFFSGHASVAFAATAVGEKLLDRRAEVKGRRRSFWNRALVWLPAAATGYLRIAGDKHYITDVAVGMGAGLLIGGSVARHVTPKPTHPEAANSRRLRLEPFATPAGPALGLVGSW
jgi:membrane-associated phospholipid phosphatase